MIKNESQSKVTTLNVNITIKCKIRQVPFKIFQNVQYIDSKKVVSGEIEIGTCEFSGNLCLLSAKVEKSRIVGLSCLGIGVDSVSCDDPTFGPILKAAWEEGGVDIEKLDTTPLSVEKFIESLQSIVACESKKEPKAMGEVCRITVTAWDFGLGQVVICFEVCNRWMKCIRAPGSFV